MTYGHSLFWSSPLAAGFSALLSRPCCFPSRLASLPPTLLRGAGGAAAVSGSAHPRSTSFFSAPRHVPITLVQVHILAQR
jgi:hypothetical protein